MRKVRTLLIAGIIGVVVGFALDPWIPIIKRICTPSFVIASGRKWAEFELR
jgi:predicted acyltransferase